MSLAFDFGFEELSKPWSSSTLALLFAASGEEEDFGTLGGPLAVADASRYAEFFELKGELLPLAAGVYAEICGGPDPLAAAVVRARAAIERNKLPVVIGEDRRVTKEMPKAPLVALWGRLGRAELDEAALLKEREAVMAGVRASSSGAFRAISGPAAVVTSRAMGTDSANLRSALSKIESPVHLSIDLDVLAPSAALTPRSIEPGGISWYNLLDAVDAVFDGPGVRSADLVGTLDIKPKSPAALLSAQILVKIAGAASERAMRNSR